MKHNNKGKKPVEEFKDSDKKELQKFKIVPAGATGLVDTILLAVVEPPISDDDEPSILTEICIKVVEKARTGDIDACRLLFDRISGQPFSYLINYSSHPEKEIETEIAYS